MITLPPISPSLKKKYDPKKHYKDVDIGTYCSSCNDRHKENCMAQVIIGSSKGTTSQTKIGNVICNALGDTGASGSCISERFYRKLNLQSFKALCKTNVRSTTGSNIVPLGIVNCLFTLGTESFSTEVIVCKHLVRSLILGEDFLGRNQIGIYYSELGKCILEHRQQELISSIELEGTPILVIKSQVKIPGRTLGVINVRSTVNCYHTGKMYDIQTNPLLREEYQNLSIVPTLHRVECNTPCIVPFIAINLSYDPITIKKGLVLGYLTSQEIEVVLKSAEVSNEHLEAYNQLCN